MNHCENESLALLGFPRSRLLDLLAESYHIGCSSVTFFYQAGHLPVAIIISALINGNLCYWAQNSLNLFYHSYFINISIVQEMAWSVIEMESTGWIILYMKDLHLLFCFLFYMPFLFVPLSLYCCFLLC